MEDQNSELEVVQNLAESAEASEQEVASEQETIAVAATEGGEVQTFEREDLPALVEAVLFVHGSPIGVQQLCDVSGFAEEDVLQAIDELKMILVERNSGVELLAVAEGFQIRTKAQFSSVIRELKSSRPRKLSAAALETLAIVAYRQPVVKSDIEAIRGVDTAPTLKTLLDRKLIRIVGYQATIGQPTLYGTTDEFLEVFGLGSLSALPSLRDLKAMKETPADEETESGTEIVDDTEDDSTETESVDGETSPNASANEGRSNESARLDG
jgi:segregation and condensation protein B